MDNGYTLFKDTYVMYQLLEFIDENGIIMLCKTSKKLTEICKQYLELEDDKRFEIYATESIHNNSILFEKYCKNNDIIKIRKIIKIDIELNWNWGLEGACEGGHIDIIKFMIEKGAHGWNMGLHYACLGGHLDIVKFVIEKGANCWNWGLEGACNGGHIDIVKFLIEKGAGNWHWGLRRACSNGYIDIVKLIIEKGFYSWNDGLYYACFGKQTNIVNLMIEKGADECGNCHKSMEEHLTP